LFASSLDAALAVVAVSLLIVVHELGHLIAAKAVGMRVEAFAVGFWKKLIAFRIGETEYRLCLIPLGGYVQVSGESSVPGEGEPHEFWSKSPGQRALFILGGVTMNLVLALVLFIVAFAIGVPFTVGEVGMTFPGEPAWEAGVKAGDKILAAGQMQNPTFEDLTRAIVLDSSERIKLRVERQGRVLDFDVEPRYDKAVGLRVIGIAWPVEPVVSRFATVGGEDGVSPAEEAGVELGDRIRAINGKPVETAFELQTELLNYPDDEIELLVERDGRSLSLRLHTEPVPQWAIGISGISSTVKALEGDGPAARLGLRQGDRVVAVNGTPVASAVEIEVVARSRLGGVELAVLRDGRELSFQTTLPDLAALARFRDSVTFEGGHRMAWVKEGSPAWNAGLRAGDTIVTVGGREVSTWNDILREGARAGKGEREVQWRRDGQVVTASVTPVEDYEFSRGHPGFVCETPKMAPHRYGALGAVRKGVVNTGRTLAEIVLMLRGFATREVSPRQMGGILTIAVVSYRAAQQGLGKLLYLTAVISGALAFLNILPIPVLDGGHLLFIILEKVRGRRLGERALLLSKAVGLAFVLLLVVYVTWNDIQRLVPGP